MPSSVGFIWTQRGEEMPAKGTRKATILEHVKVLTENSQSGIVAKGGNSSAKRMALTRARRKLATSTEMQAEYQRVANEVLRITWTAGLGILLKAHLERIHHVIYAEKPDMELYNTLITGLERLTKIGVIRSEYAPDERQRE
jgi:hypothetical protein